jgi:hypothetical protein
MNRLFATLALCFMPLFAQAANVAPLGLEIGVADLATVKAKLKGQTRLTEAGINKWTQGPMLKSNGEGLDVEGLKEITFIFGQDEKLDGVIMTLGKDRLEEVTAALRKKYKKVPENIPFVGDASALYRQGDSVVRAHRSAAPFLRHAGALPLQPPARSLREGIPCRRS